MPLDEYNDFTVSPFVAVFIGTRDYIGSYVQTNSKWY